MIVNIFDLYGITRFNIYYSCYSNSGSFIEDFHVAIAGYCSCGYSIFHLHVSV